MFSVEQRIQAFDTDYIVGVFFREKTGEIGVIDIGTNETWAIISGVRLVDFHLPINNLKWCLPISIVANVTNGNGSFRWWFEK